MGLYLGPQRIEESIPGVVARGLEKLSDEYVIQSRGNIDIIRTGENPIRYHIMPSPTLI